MPELTPNPQPGKPADDGITLVKETATDPRELDPKAVEAFIVLCKQNPEIANLPCMNDKFTFERFKVSLDIMQRYLVTQMPESLPNSGKAELFIHKRKDAASWGGTEKPFSLSEFIMTNSMTSGGGEFELSDLKLLIPEITKHLESGKIPFSILKPLDDRGAYKVWGWIPPIPA